MSPGTEFARDFCAGIGPLQLGVVLVFLIFGSERFFFLECCSTFIGLKLKPEMLVIGMIYQLNLKKNPKVCNKYHL